MLPERIASAASPALSSCGRSQLETSNCERPASTSFWTSHETGATFVYHGQRVRLEWQSPHASMNRARVRGLSQAGSLVVGGFVWLRPYGTSWIARKRMTAEIPTRRAHRRSVV